MTDKELEPFIDRNVEAEVLTPEPGSVILRGTLKYVQTIAHKKYYNVGDDKTLNSATNFVSIKRYVPKGFIEVKEGEWFALINTNHIQYVTSNGDDATRIWFNSSMAESYLALEPYDKIMDKIIEARK